ncbi:MULTISPECIES: hypothetical protein [unclassified Rhizobium]|uniref:hypothetical protein n=1 Tax=unclassified Rhizobium TaxID=2613769 RepID=UPI0037F374AF
MTDLQLRHPAPDHCCRYCLKPIGYLGRGLSRLFGAKIHNCDFLNVDTEANRLRLRVEAAEDDAVRIHHEKVDLLKRLFEANRALKVCRREALEDAAKIADNWLSYHPSEKTKFHDIAAAIRSLSDSAPTPLQEQTANIGKEEK